MPGIGEPPAGSDAVLPPELPELDEGRPADDDELREPGREGIDEDEEGDEDAPGIDGDDDEDVPGIDGADDELGPGEDDAPGIAGDELLELELLVLSHPPRIRLRAETARTALIAGRFVTYRNGVRMLFPPQLRLLRNRSVFGFTRPSVRPGRVSSDFSGRWSTPGE